ncbi:adenylate/guanylate cyclase domain-containing protein [Sphingomonas sp. CFBP 13720]|uniref:adenylate/guanylate cyclase domain-containing protein n=1 Tax=Sphingomonas sp. CFBP 13720 TaxID=2775302 RepID=UPI00201780F2|nr:adenylate/guanylate cyclase domain-containing protein [Sphingomonas sp. CFBP 13720]
MAAFRDSLIQEAETILGKDFTVEVTATKIVPHSGDSKITFPNLDEKRQLCKLVDTCVLYIDMRRSTELSLRLKPQTVAKLYSTFVRCMTRCARYYKGHVRGIIGDRVMVLFDEEDAFSNAVNCAVLMNSVAKYVINKHFASGEVTFGLGIDSGKMLVTKTGIRKNGVDQSNYRNLVWLGKPANLASKLTDAANKAGEYSSLKKLLIVYERPNLFTGKTDWMSEWEWPHEFVQKLTDTGYPSYQLRYQDPEYRAVYVHDTTETVRPYAPPILMSSRVWQAFKASAPSDTIISKGMVSEVAVVVPGLSGKVFGGDIVFPLFK